GRASPTRCCRSPARAAPTGPTRGSRSSARSSAACSLRCWRWVFPVCSENKEHKTKNKGQHDERHHGCHLCSLSSVLCSLRRYNGEEADQLAGERCQG